MIRPTRFPDTAPVLRPALVGLALVGLAAAGCGGGMFTDGPERDGGVDPNRDGGSGSDFGQLRDGSTPTGDAIEPNWDAFFADDPPPEYCGPDGGSWTPPPLPGGTPECPSDKNREGCPCDNIGEQVACWPGKRVDRNRGICKDGQTTCEAFNEFRGRWGACAGYVLPTEGATKGAAACNCFSSGRWTLDNTSPCFWTYGTNPATDPTYAVSTYMDAQGNAQCPDNDPDQMPPPEPQPGQPWSTTRLKVDCAGQFKLCYTIKAGDVTDPKPTDCVVAETCIDVWYGEKNVEQELPSLPAWTSSDRTCSEQFVAAGGYGEMSVIGLSAECEPVDDGNGQPYVFHRAGYCPAECNENPSLPGCENCRQGGSGVF